MTDNYVNTYYMPTDLETMYALSPLVGISEQISDYDNLKYRFAWAGFVGTIPAYLNLVAGVPTIKGDFAPYLATHLKAAIRIAIDYYGHNPTFAELQAAFVDQNLDALTAFYMSYFVVYLWAIMPEDLGPQLLTAPQTFAGWGVANGFSVDTETLYYQHNAGGGTASRVSFTGPLNLGTWHKLDLTISGRTGSCGTLTIGTEFASVATNALLGVVDGKQTIVMKSNIGGVTNFVFTAAGSSAGAEYRIDNVELNEIQANMTNLDVNGIPTTKIQQTIADFALRIVRELRIAEAKFYNGNPVV